MSGRLTYMKYTAIVAVAVLSLLIAIPLSRQPAKQQITMTFKPVATKVALKKLSQTKVVATVQKQVVTPVALPTTTHPSLPVATVQPTTVVTASFSCQNYSNLFDQYNWNAATAMAICQAESQGNPNAISNGNINYDGIPDYGLMQLHGLDILDPAANINAAYAKYLSQGWSAWSTYNSGKYAQYL